MAPSSTPSSTARPTSGPQVARTPASSSLRAGLRRGNAEAAPKRLVLVGAVCVGAGRERDRPTHGPAGADTRRLVGAGPEHRGEDEDERSSDSQWVHGRVYEGSHDPDL